MAERAGCLDEFAELARNLKKCQYAHKKHVRQTEQHSRKRNIQHRFKTEKSQRKKS